MKIKKLLIIPISILYFTLYICYKIISFIIPGRCDICMRQRWNFGRTVSIGENDAPVIMCKKCLNEAK